MRVIHFACVAPPVSGGIGQAAYDEVVGLRARGVEAQLISSIPYGAEQEREDNLIIKRLPSWIHFGNAALIKKLTSAHRDADIIHLHYPWYGVAERLLWMKPNKPVVVTFHMDAIAHDLRGLGFALHRWFFQKRLLQNASRVLVSSRDYAEHSSLAPLLSGLGNKIVELPFGLDADFFSPSLSSDSASRFTILFVGALDRAHSFKGLSVLLQALTKLDSACHLQIVGEGGERVHFERQVKELALADRVHFLGRVGRTELRDLYRTAQALALPSTTAAEAFGLVALEAQACGLPVVASRWPGVRTVVRDGETGILVEPGSVEALVEAFNVLRSQEPLRRQYAENARKHCLKSFTTQVHIDKLIEVYQAL